MSLGLLIASMFLVFFLLSLYGAGRAARATSRAAFDEEPTKPFIKVDESKLYARVGDGDMPDGSFSCNGRERGWMQTFSGRKFYPLDPQRDDVELADVAHGLAMTCRYGGQCKRFYSVAEHCVVVSEYVERVARERGWSDEAVRAVAREALFHDSAEAYIGDMIRPLKHQPEMSEFRKAEASIEVAIFAKFAIASTDSTHELVKEIDNRVLIDEISQLMPDAGMYLETPLIKTITALGAQLACLDPATAEATFMLRYKELFQ